LLTKRVENKPQKSEEEILKQSNDILLSFNNGVPAQIITLEELISKQTEKGQT
jgi:hypothetical protein